MREGVDGEGEEGRLLVDGDGHHDQNLMVGWGFECIKFTTGKLRLRLLLYHHGTNHGARKTLILTFFVQQS